MNSIAAFLNIGMPELILILFVALLLFGAKRLPELARGMGQAINEFTKAKDDLQRHVSRMDEPPVRRPAEIQERNAPVVEGEVAATAPVETRKSEA